MRIKVFKEFKPGSVMMYRNLDSTRNPRKVGKGLFKKITNHMYEKCIEHYKFSGRTYLPINLLPSEVIGTGFWELGIIYSNASSAYDHYSSYNCLCDHKEYNYIWLTLKDNNPNFAFKITEGMGVNNITIDYEGYLKYLSFEMEI